QMRTVLVAGVQPATVEGGCRANALWHCSGGAHDDGSAHAVTGGADLAAGVHRSLLVKPGYESACVSHMGFCAQATHQGHDNTAYFRVAESGTFTHDRRFGAAIEGIDYQHRVTGLSQTLAHGSKGGAQAENIRPDDHSSMAARGRV